MIVLSESDVENLSPSAAAASRLLKSGKTLTEIYAEYIDLTDQLQVEKDTNARLNMYLSQILKVYMIDKRNLSSLKCLFLIRL